MKRIRHIGVLMFLALLCCPLSSFAQSIPGQNNNMIFFVERGKKDALIEQTLQLPQLEDEVDYWKDQRIFEKALKKMSYQGYQAYLNAKLVVYNDHAQRCDAQCVHGQYYYLQASFYTEVGTPDIGEPVVLSVANTTHTILPDNKDNQQ